MSFFSALGGYIAAVYNGVWNLFVSSPASGAAPASPSAILGSRSAPPSMIAHNPQRQAEYPATNVPLSLLSNALSYTTPDDTVTVVLTMAQANSQMRDKAAAHVFSQLHNVVRFTRASPEQDEHVLSVFSKARPSAGVDTLTLREVRADPLTALRMIVDHRPLQLTTIDFYKVDLVPPNSATAATDAVALFSQCTQLTNVTLSDCGLTHPNSVATVVTALLTKLPKLRRLDLSANRFRVDGAVALAAQPVFLDPSQMVVFSLPCLEHLDLGGSSLGARGLETLLRVHFPGHATPNLKLLDLRDNSLRDEGARLVSRFLGTVTLSVASGAASGAASAAVAAAAAVSVKQSPVPKLEILEMSSNEISPEAVKAMREAFLKVRLFA